MDSLFKEPEHKVYTIYCDCTSKTIRPVVMKPSLAQGFYRGQCSRCEKVWVEKKDALTH